MILFTGKAPYRTTSSLIIVRLGNGGFYGIIAISN